MPDNEEIVNVPVPARFLPVVYQALSEAMRVERAPEPQNESATPAAHQSGALDFTDVSVCRRLREGVTSPGLVNGLVQMLDALAKQPDEWVSFLDIAATTGRSRDQLQGDTRSLTRVIKRVFGNDRDYADWPIKKDWGLKGDSQRYYMMTSDVARAWLAS